MSDPFDIQPAADAILNGDDLIKIEGLPDDRSRFDAGDSDGLFAADVPGGVTLVGQRSILVQGSLDGAAGNPCHIKINGDLIVTGDVHYAQISCRNLHIGGAVNNAQLSITSREVSVGGDLAQTRLQIGEYEVHWRRIEQLKNESKRIREQREAADRSISQEEKRMDRSCKATRTFLNFNISKLISHENNRVRVHLSAFFRSLDAQPQDKLKEALLEFFAKGIVGILTRNNSKYIGNNPARKKVFLQLLKALRKLVLLTFERDLLIATIDKNGAEIDQLFTELNRQDGAVCIQGEILPGTEVAFTLPKAQRLDDGEVQCLHQSASLKVQPGSQSGELHLELTGVDGETSAQDLGTDKMQRIALRTREGQIIWVPVQNSPT